MDTNIRDLLILALQTVGLIAGGIFGLWRLRLSMEAAAQKTTLALEAAQATADEKQATAEQKQKDANEEEIRRISESFRQLLHESYERYDELRGEVRGERARNDQLQKTVEQLIEYRRQDAAKIGELELARTTLEQQIQEALETVDITNRQLTETNQKLKEREAENSANREQIETLTQRLNGLESEKIAALALVEKRNGELKDRDLLLKQRDDELRERTARIEELSNQLQTTKDDLQDVSNRLAKLEKKDTGTLTQPAPGANGVSADEKKPIGGNPS